MINKYFLLKEELIYLYQRDLRRDEINKQILISDGSLPGKRGKVEFTLFSHDSCKILDIMWEKMIVFLQDDGVVFNVKEEAHHIMEEIVAKNL